jgi:hypothetical protein
LFDEQEISAIEIRKTTFKKYGRITLLDTQNEMVSGGGYQHFPHKAAARSTECSTEDRCPRRRLSCLSSNEA